MKTPTLLAAVLLAAGVLIQPPVCAQEAQTMSIEQTLSDDGQRNTIAFAALSFITGSLGSDSFFPPGKLADFWGFQYLRDNDATGMGHNTAFLSKAANNLLYVLDDADRARLIALAESQVEEISDYGYDRFPLMWAFRRLLDGEQPDDAGGLDEAAVKAYSARLYRLDGEITRQRAQVMGPILAGLNEEQRSYLEGLRDVGMLNWPDVGDQIDTQSLDHDVHVAVMTYAADMLSWYLGSLEADTYFAPERQGTYFGSFYMKDAPAMGNADYVIDTALTGDLGQMTLDLLDDDQAALLTTIVDEQRDALEAIVETREAVSTLLRNYLDGGSVDDDTLATLMARYGELDGEIVWRYATRFAALGQSLSEAQRAGFNDLRYQALGDYAPEGAFHYSDPIPLPEEPNTDYLFDGGVDDCAAYGGIDEADAAYDPAQGMLTLTHLAVGDARYTAWLQWQSDGLFHLLRNEVETTTEGGIGGCYDATDNTLNVPAITIDGTRYAATLKHTGDWQFFLDSISSR